MYVIDLNFNNRSADMFKQLMSSKSMYELNELNTAYVSRARAMQQNWMNDWARLNQNLFSGAFNPSNQQAEQMPNTIQQQITDQCAEYTKFVSNACESYGLWFIKQANNSD